MNSFTCHNPVKVVFGLGTLKQVGEEAVKLGKRALVVSYGDASVAGTLVQLKELATPHRQAGRMDTTLSWRMRPLRLESSLKMRKGGLNNRYRSNTAVLRGEV